MGFSMLFAAIAGLYSFEAVSSLLRRSSSWVEDALWAALSFGLSAFAGSLI